MLELINSEPVAPARCVVLGARGFVGAAAAGRLAEDGIDILRLTRSDVDLLAAAAAAALAENLKPDDALVVVSARAPCKDIAMLMDNWRMMEAVCAALAASAVAHIVYISSDAVYADSAEPLTEDACAEPGSLHGIMHLAREAMLKEVAGETPLAILRPSLLYGAADPHNGYGPNRFRRQAAAGEDIVLFGEGEERRDHVLIDDVAEIIRLVAIHRGTGVLNIATGEVVSFREIAEMVVSHFAAPADITGSPRPGPMPHNGYRPFDISATRAAFPDFRYTMPVEGIARVHRIMVGSG